MLQALERWERGLGRGGGAQVGAFPSHRGLYFFLGPQPSPLIISFNDHVTFPAHYHDPVSVMVLRLQVNETTLKMACIIMTFITERDENPGRDEAWVWLILLLQGHSRIWGLRKGPQGGVSLDPREGKEEEDSTSYCLLSTPIA